MKVVHKKEVKQKSLLVYADWNCTTGFGAVAKELVNEWAKDKKLSIVIFGINDASQKIYNYLPNVKVIPALIIGDENSKKDIYRSYRDNFKMEKFMDMEYINFLMETFMKYFL